MMTTETVRRWDASAGEWHDVTLELTPEPVRRKRARRRAASHGAPRDLTGLSAGAPLPSWWRDTAYAPGEPLADMRTYLKPPAIRTHRAAIVMPADPGRITVTA